MSAMSAESVDPLVVSGVSAITAIGHDAAVSYASARAGLARIVETREFQVRDARRKLTAVTCAAVDGVTDGQRRYARQYRMAVRAFAELIDHARLDDAALENASVHLGLHEPARPGMDDRLGTDLVPAMCETLALENLSSRTTVDFAGHAVAFLALESAAREIASGRCARAVVGAVDGYLDEVTLQWLADTGRLKGEGHGKGFVPGEAAAFLLVEPLSAARARGARCLARLTGIGSAMEANSLYDETPCLGQGLTQAVGTALRMSAADGPVTLVSCDLNGERHRANEWALVLARSGVEHASPDLWHPAACLGDCGAASGALNLAFGALAVARGDLVPGQALAWGSSDDGERGAAVFAPVRSTAVQ